MSSGFRTAPQAAEMQGSRGLQQEEASLITVFHGKAFRASMPPGGPLSLVDELMMDPPHRGNGHGGAKEWTIVYHTLMVTNRSPLLGHSRVEDESESLRGPDARRGRCDVKTEEDRTRGVSEKGVS